MTKPIDSILAKLAARRGLIAPEIAEQRDANGKRVDKPTAPAALIERDTAAWTTLVSEFMLPRSGEVAQVHLTVCGPAGTLEVDDVVVEANPKCTSGGKSPAARKLTS